MWKKGKFGVLRCIATHSYTRTRRPRRGRVRLPAGVADREEAFAGRLGGTPIVNKGRLPSAEMMAGNAAPGIGAPGGGGSVSPQGWRTVICRGAKRGADWR
jgi:hypothetical protein